VVAAVAAAAEGVDEPVVPAGLLARRGRAGAVVERRDLVHGTVDDAGLDPHDVGHRRAGHGRRRQVGGARRRVGERRERPGRGAVLVADHRRRRAQRLLRRVEPERRRLAEERHLLAAGEDRAGARVVRDAHARALAAVARGQRVAPVAQAGDEPDERAVRLPHEGAGDVVAVAAHAHVLAPGDPHEGVAAAHELGLGVRRGGDRQPRLVVRGRRGGGGDAGEQGGQRHGGREHDDSPAAGSRGEHVVILPPRGAPGNGRALRKINWLAWLADRRGGPAG
jgi:hypothetical protein